MQLKGNIIRKSRHGQRSEALWTAGHKLLRLANRLIWNSTNYESLYYAVITIFLLLVAVLDPNSHFPID